MGYWIRIDADTLRKGTVRTMARTLGVSRHEVVGRLLAVWAQAEEVHGDRPEPRGDLVIPGWTGGDIDDEAGLAGFAEAMAAVGYLRIDEGGVTLPDYHWETAKERRLRAADRAKKARERRAERGASRDDGAHGTRSVRARGAQPAREVRCTKRSEAKRSAAPSPLTGREGAAAGDAARPDGGPRATPAEIQAADEAVRASMAALSREELAAAGSAIRGALTEWSQGGDDGARYAEWLLDRLNGCPPHADNEHWRRAFALHLTPAEPAGRTA